jgi:hypothetical protein
MTVFDCLFPHWEFIFIFTNNYPFFDHCAKGRNIFFFFVNDRQEQ